MDPKFDHQYDLFISYADADRAWVEGYLLDALTAAGVKCHSEAAFSLGTPRLLEFERAIRESARTLLVISPAYLADDTAGFFNLLAQAYGLDTSTWPVIPLKLRPAEMPMRLAMLTGVDATDPAEWPDVIERLCDEFNRPLPAQAQKPDCPYPGMRAFEESDSHFFFGRGAEVEDLKQQLRQHPFITVIGPSGSGKSSVVFAGLIPELRRSQLFGPGTWVVRRMRPGQTPLTNLEGALAGVSRDAEGAVANALAAEEGARLLLVVDQFEELFTQGGAEGPSFQERLLNLMRAPNLYLALTARADFYPDLMASPLWPQIKLYRQEILPLGEDGLRDVILMPAEKVNVFVESALVERLASDAAGEPGILPFVQETMRLLWDHVERRLLPLRAYEALVLPRKAYDMLGGGGGKLSGLQVAIALHADVSLKELGEQQEPIARRIFLRLVQFGEGRADTRRQQPVAELRSADDDPDVFAATLRHLVKRRLLTVSGQEDGPGTKVDISHEALIAGWYTLRGWVGARREAELTRRRLEAKAKEWVGYGKGEGGLLDETELAEAEGYMKRPEAAELGYDPDLKELLDKSLAAIQEAKKKAEEARQRELKLEREARKAAQTRNHIAAALLLLLGALTIYAFIVRDRAQKSALEVRRQSVFNLSKLSQLYLATNQPLESLASALAAARRVKDQGWAQSEQPFELFLTLQQAVYGVRERNRFQGHEGEVSSVSPSPDGQLVASGGDDKAVKLWRADGSLVRTFTGHEGAVTEVAFSPDGQTIASTGFDRVIRLWNLEGNTLKIIPVGDPNKESNWVSSVTFSRDGQKLAAAAADQTVRVWNVGDGSLLKTFPHEKKVIEVCFIPNSELLASAGEDGLVIIWNLNGGRQQAIRAQDDKPVFGVDASPDGQTIATAGEDNNVKLWALDGTLKKTLAGHEDDVLNVRFSPDGRTLASAGKEGTVRLWNLSDGSAQIFRGHRGAVSAVRFSPDGQTIYSAGNDETVRLWSVTSQLPILRHDAGAGDSGVYGVAYSPDGKMLATASEDQSIRLWQSDGRFVRALTGHEGFVLSVGFSPDGKQLVSGGEDKKVRLWDLNGGVKILGEHSGPVKSICFSPDGKSIASASDDHKIKLWGLSGEPPREIDNGSEVNSVSFSPDGRTIAAAGDDKKIKLWKTDGEPLQTLEDHESEVLTARFSPDGDLLASGGADNTVRLWRRSGDRFEPLRVLRGHGESVLGVSFNSASGILASVSSDQTVKFWSPDGQLIQTVENSYELFDVSFSPDGKSLVTAGTLASGPDGLTFTGLAVIWNLDLDDLIARGCGWIKDYLKTNPNVDESQRAVCQ